jgi:hypothetical protein
MLSVNVVIRYKRQREELRRDIMIKKAIERPKKVEYVEFKGQENFKEVDKRSFLL